MTAEATADCEERDTWFLDQDVNAWTSLAYAVVGVLIIALAARRRLRIVFVALGLLSVAEGVGSFLYHGSTGDIAHYVHDIALVGALGFVAGWHVGRIAGRPDAAALAGTALTIAVGSVVWAAAPSSTNVMVAVAVAVVAVAEVVGRRRRLPAVWNLPLLALAAGALVVWWAGGPDSPACDAGSWIQPHGLWHTLTALLVLGWVDRASYAADPEHAPRLFGRVPGGLPRWWRRSVR